MGSLQALNSLVNRKTRSMTLSPLRKTPLFYHSAYQSTSVFAGIILSKISTRPQKKLWSTVLPTVVRVHFRIPSVNTKLSLLLRSSCRCMCKSGTPGYLRRCSSRSRCLGSVEGMLQLSLAYKHAFDCVTIALQFHKFTIGRYHSVFTSILTLNFCYHREDLDQWLWKPRWSPWLRFHLSNISAP